MTARVKTVAPKKRATKRRTPPKLTIAGQEAVGTLCVVGSLPREWSESGVLRVQHLPICACASLRAPLL